MGEDDGKAEALAWVMRALRFERLVVELWARGGRDDEPGDAIATEVLRRPA